jgi:hypothetical protein
LIYTHREITYPIKVKELFQLTQLNIRVNKIGKELLIEENIKLALRYYQTYLQHREYPRKCLPKILALGR